LVEHTVREVATCARREHELARLRGEGAWILSRGPLAERQAAALAAATAEVAALRVEAADAKAAAVGATAELSALQKATDHLTVRPRGGSG